MHQEYHVDIGSAHMGNIAQSHLSQPTYNTDGQRLLSGYGAQNMVSPHYEDAQISTSYAPSLPESRKRSHEEDPPLDYAGLELPIDMAQHNQQVHSRSSSFPVHRHHLASQSHSPQPSGQSAQQHQPPILHGQSPPAQVLQHHHHRLPNHPPPAKQARYVGSSSPIEDVGPPNMVGREGMPIPAAKPKGPKLKFTRDDDSLLIELKETKNLTWKQIADFFPGRSSGTLQVRYCTKLKAKTTAWSDEMVTKLRTAMQDYDNDRWRIISSKVGNGFSATACQAKADELAMEDQEPERSPPSESDA